MELYNVRVANCLFFYPFCFYFFFFSFLPYLVNVWRSTTALYDDYLEE